MIMNQFTIYDTVMKIYNTTWNMPNIESAERQFANMVNDPKKTV